MRLVPFMKANGCGNDFLLVEEQLAPGDIHAFTRAICDRNAGVGADGVEWIGAKGSRAGEAYDASARLVNSDGSEAELSGNGTRCVAAYLASQQNLRSLKILTGAGVKNYTLTANEPPLYEFESNMGAAIVMDEREIIYGEAKIVGRSVSMGNPHFVVIGKLPS